jgi:hypothetical protein
MKKLCYLSFSEKDWMYNNFVMGFGPTFLFTWQVD